MVFVLNNQVKASYIFDKKLKSKLVIVAENKGVTQTELVIEYINKGLKEDEKYLTSHLD